MASGEPLRAPIRRFSSPANRKASANAPRSRGSDRLTASTGRGAALHFFGDQMRDHLGVGFGREFGALCLQLAPQLGEILDDAVMHDGELVGRVRMRVVLGRPAVRRPAGMADADGAGQRLAREPDLEVFQLAFGAAAGQHAVFERRHAGGIVAAVFEALERLDELRRSRLSGR